MLERLLALAFSLLGLLVGSVVSVRLEKQAGFQFASAKSHRDNSIQAQIPSLCETKWLTQVVDHFGGRLPPSGDDTYQMRYLVCGKWWAGSDSPIFFYTGNEGDVFLYVNNTGLMWENAEQFGAVLIFAEHRYYGQSIPSPSSDRTYLTHEQALADYAHLISTFKTEHNAHKAPVIAFGGSYGGMLSAWFRLKYPHVIDGSIASSAPIGAFEEKFDSSLYWQQVTHDASVAGGSCEECVNNVKATWPILKSLSATSRGLETLSSVFKTCRSLTSAEEVERLRLYLTLSWDTMAMGNFPYPSSYLTGGQVNMTAYPVRKACSHLKDAALREPSNQLDLLKHFNDAVNVFRNASMDLKCLEVPKTMMESVVWDYQWCTELLCEETYFSMDGESDMFYKFQLTREEVAKHCNDTHGVIPRYNWIRTSYGSLAEIARYGSNIVFTNGDFDPWMAAGVKKSLSPTLPALTIHEGAHHLDLMFSHESDSESVMQVRDQQVEHMWQWVRSRL